MKGSKKTGLKPFLLRGKELSQLVPVFSRGSPWAGGAPTAPSRAPVSPLTVLRGSAFQRRPFGAPGHTRGTGSFNEDVTEEPGPEQALSAVPVWEGHQGSPQEPQYPLTPFPNRRLVPTPIFGYAGAPCPLPTGECPVGLVPGLGLAQPADPWGGLSRSGSQCRSLSSAWLGPHVPPGPVPVPVPFPVLVPVAPGGPRPGSAARPMGGRPMGDTSRAAALPSPPARRRGG